MKYALLQLLLIISFCAVRAVAHAHYKKQEPPLLVVVLMVKNEATVIRETLQPFVAAGVQHYLILDTGSTDNTPQVVADYFAAHHITDAYVEQEPFVDFATSRNRALELAEERFPDATFLLMLDAEWYLSDAQKLLSFCKTHQKETEHHDAFLIRIHTTDLATGRVLDFHLPRLMRPQARLRFKGKIHEYLDIATAKKIPFDVYFDVRQAATGAHATKLRLQRDLRDLLHAYSSDPEDPRTIYFLAQTYVSLENLPEAYHLFVLCASKIAITKDTPADHLEYAYQASYNAGVLAQALAQHDARFTWQQAYTHYLCAFASTGQHAEPLMRIAQHYWDSNNMHLCFIFARHAAELAYPTFATGLVETDVYAFRRYDLLGACAGNIGRWDVAEWAVKKAIEAEPGKQHLRHNLAVILEMSGF